MELDSNQKKTLKLIDEDTSQTVIRLKMSLSDTPNILDGVSPGDTVASGEGASFPSLRPPPRSGHNGTN